MKRSPPVSLNDQDIPRAPRVSVRDILNQVRLDAYGKEVQSAMTYSYTWMADQVGHICIGIVLVYVLTQGAGFVLAWLGLPPGRDQIAGFAAAALIVSAWELCAYRSSVAEATGVFPLDRALLRDNAIIAAGYMIIGAGIGFTFGQPWPINLIGIVTLLALGAIFAPPWLRQKIIWQKAALPYLFRLADAQRTIGAKPAQALQALIDRGAPPDIVPTQIIVGGPIGSGRTRLAAGIGTEFAFRRSTVRYLSMDALLEHAAQKPNPNFADDTGPANINFWRWSEAQVVIIDDIGPLIAAQAQEQRANLEQFRTMLNSGLANIAPALAKCHTVWVIGDLNPDGEPTLVGEVLDDFARVVAGFCQAKGEALVIELSNAPEAASTGKPAIAPALPSDAKLRSVNRVAPASNSA